MQPTVINDKLESMFQEHGVQYVKKPIKLHYDIADHDGVCHTKEGDVSYKKGAAIMTGTEGEQWPIEADTFLKTYAIAGEGLAAKRAIPVYCVELKEDADVQASWGLLHGKAGDTVVQYGPGDYGVVDRKIFADTYARYTSPETVQNSSVRTDTIIRTTSTGMRVLESVASSLQWNEVKHSTDIVDHSNTDPVLDAAAYVDGMQKKIMHIPSESFDPLQPKAKAPRNR